MIKVYTEKVAEYELMDRICRNMMNVRIYMPNDYPCRTCKEQAPGKPKKKYRIRPRFFFFLGLAIMAIILFIIYTRPETLFTSNYWRG
jgi:hypothetical protein